MKRKIIAVILTAAMAVSSLQVLGTKNVNAESADIGSFVRRLYNVCLDRDAATEEIDYWKNTIDVKGNTGISLAYEFVQSQEFLSKDLTNEEYVSYMYSALMGRDASEDPDGVAYWASLMDGGATKEEIFVGFANSDEFFYICNDYDVVAGTAMVGKDPHELVGVNYFTDRCYNVILGRDCDRGGMEYWSTTLATNATAGATLVENFLFSDEYVSMNKSDDDFLSDLYVAMMGREPVRAELDYWISVIEAGAPDRTIFRDFVGAPEFTEICNSYGIIPGTVSEDGPEDARQDDEPTPTPLPHFDVTIASFNEEIEYIIREFAGVEADYVFISSQMYQDYLDYTFASGEDAPDLFVTDMDYARNYITSDYTLPMSELGITSADTASMFDYTIQYGSDNGTLKAVSYQVSPSVVFYNRDVAQQTLGVSEPEDVAPYFADWEAVANTAFMVREQSQGTVRITSGYDEFYRSFVTGSTWNVGTGIGIDGTREEFMMFAQYLTDGDYVWGDGMWTDGWMERACDGSVLSYWGPLWLGKYSLALEPNEWNANPTAGNWGVVNCPDSFAWGGNFINASMYCQDKEAAGAIVKALCCNTDTLTSMAIAGEFVNNISVMTSMATNEAWNLEMLAGQNPVAVMIQAANTTAVPYTYNSVAEGVYSSVLADYVHGNFETLDEAIAEFQRLMSDNDLGIVVSRRYWLSDVPGIYYAISELWGDYFEYPVFNYTTGHTFIGWSISYNDLWGIEISEAEEFVNSSDMFVLEVVYNGEVIATAEGQSEFQIYDYFGDEYGNELCSGSSYCQIGLEPFGGQNLRSGSYEIRIYDSNHVLVEVDTFTL